MANVKIRSLIVFSFLLSLALGIFTLVNRQSLAIPPSSTLELDSPYIVRDYGDLRYILDRQRTRIVIIEKDTGALVRTLPRAGDKETFTYADDFLVDSQGCVYVKEGGWKGNRIAREAVLRYDPDGKFTDSYISTDYAWLPNEDTSLINKHRIMLLSVEDNILCYGIKKKDTVEIHSLNVKNLKKSKSDGVKIYFFKNAFNLVNDMTIGKDGEIYMLDKAGRLYVLKDSVSGIPELVAEAKDGEYPNWIEGTDGGLLYTDLYCDGVKKLDFASGSSSLIIPECGSATVTPLPFSDLKNPVKKSGRLLWERILLAVALLSLLSFAAFLFFLFLAFMRSEMHVIRRITVYIILIVLAVSATITFKLTEEFSKTMRSQILIQMENMAYSVANTIPAASLDAIHSAKDFDTDSYRALIASMESVIDTRLDINSNVYCDLFKIDEAHGAYACAYLDQAIGTYYPLSESEISEIEQIYKSKKPVNSSKNDTSASYTYASVPVINDAGRVCGVVSVMTENFMLDDKISAMKKSVLLGIVVTMIFIWLLMSEILSYVLSKSRAQMEKSELLARGLEAPKAFPDYSVRLIVFALFASYNMSTTFLPMIIANGAFESLGGGSHTLAAALPISVNLLIIGLMALFCEGTIRRIGMRKTVVIGASLSAFSNLLIFAFPDLYALLFVSLILDGIGVGLTTNALYLLVSQIPDASGRTAGYAAYNAAQISGINFGMLSGAALASNIGRLPVFPIVTLMWLVTALLFCSIWKSLGLSSGKKAEEKSSSSNPARIISFLRRRKVWSSILLLQCPFALMGSFIYYYLPLYADSNSLSEVTVAVLMMIYAAFAIYAGGWLTRQVVTYTGRLCPYVAVTVCASALGLYAFIGNITGLLLAIFLMGLANGFGRSVLQSHFSILKECEEFGIPDSMGVFNFTDFIGQSFGPAVMGAVLLSKNSHKATLLFVIVLAVLTLTHIVANLPKKKAKGE